LSSIETENTSSANETTLEKATGELKVSPFEKVKPFLQKEIWSKRKFGLKIKDNSHLH